MDECEYKQAYIWTSGSWDSLWYFDTKYFTLTIVDLYDDNPSEMMLESQLQLRVKGPFRDPQPHPLIFHQKSWDFYTSRSL